MNDTDLVARAGGGDAVAFEVLVRRHADDLWRLARSIVRDDHLAEEAVQDTFLKAHRALQTFRAEAAVKTWLSSICYRTCVDALRTRRARVVPLDAARLRASAEDHDARLSMQAAVATLAEPERQAFTLVHVLGYSRDEAAAIVGVPASTMRSRASRACVRLAELLTESSLATNGGQQP